MPAAMAPARASKARTAATSASISFGESAVCAFEICTPASEMRHLALSARRLALPGLHEGLSLGGVGVEPEDPEATECVTNLRVYFGHGVRHQSPAGQSGCSTIPQRVKGSIREAAGEDSGRDGGHAVALAVAAWATLWLREEASAFSPTPS